LDPLTSEQEQLEQLKEWWKRNGIALVGGVLLGAAVVLGWNLWRNHKTGQAEAASVLYEQMMVDYKGKQKDAAEAAGAKLMQDYSATPYAGMAALYLARISFESGDRISARSQLQWAIDNAKVPATVHAARLRLGRLLESAGEYSQALKLTNIKDGGGYVSAYAELRGDLYVDQGKPKQARPEYQRALENLPRGSTYAKILQMKLDDLGESETNK
jgi:predicted negative regulator of RcsB-dependent stress response